MAEFINFGPGPVEENVGVRNPLEDDLIPDNNIQLGVRNPLEDDLIPDNNIQLLDDEVLYSINTNGKIVVTGVYPQNKYEWDKPNVYDVNWVDNTTIPFIVAISDGKSYPKFFTSKYYYQKLKSAFESTNPNPYFLEESFRVATLVKIDVTDMVRLIIDNELDERTDKVVVYKNVFVSKQYSAVSNEDGEAVYTLEDFGIDYASLIKYIDWTVKKRNPAVGDDYNTVLDEQEIGNYVVNRINLRPSPTYDKFGIRILNQDVESFNGLVYSAKTRTFEFPPNIIALGFTIGKIFSGDIKPSGLSWKNGDSLEFVNYTSDPLEIEVEFSTDPINTLTSANQSEWLTLSDIFKQMDSFIIPAQSKTVKKVEFKPAVDPISLQPIINARDYILDLIKNIIPNSTILNGILSALPSSISVFGWPQYFNDNNLSTLNKLKPNGLVGGRDTAYRGVIKFTIKGTNEFIAIRIELRKQAGENFTP